MKNSSCFTYGYFVDVVNEHFHGLIHVKFHELHYLVADGIKQAVFVDQLEDILVLQPGTENTSQPYDIQKMHCVQLFVS